MEDKAGIYGLKDKRECKILLVLFLKNIIMLNLVKSKKKKNNTENKTFICNLFNSTL